MFQPLGPLRPTWVLIVTLVAVLIVAVWVLIVLHSAEKKRRTQSGEQDEPSPTFGRWPAFFSGFGLTQLAIAATAMLLASASLGLRPPSRVIDNAQELSVTPGDAKPKIVNVRGLSKVSITATVVEPEGSAATLQLVEGTDNIAATRQLHVTAGKWVVWQGVPKGDELRITAMKPENASLPAAKVVKIVVVTQKPAR